MNLALAATMLALSALGRLAALIYHGAVEGFASIGAAHPHHAQSAITPQDTKRL